MIVFVVAEQKMQESHRIDEVKVVTTDYLGYRNLVGLWWWSKSTESVNNIDESNNAEGTSDCGNSIENLIEDASFQVNWKSIWFLKISLE